MAENHSLSSSSLTIILLLLCLFFSSLLIISFFRRTTTPNLPPSPPRWPVIGNLRQLGSVFHRSLRSLSDVHGPVMLIHVGMTRTLVLSSSEAVKELVRNHDADASDRPSTTAAKVMTYGNRNLGFAPYGEFWRKAKRVTVQELLSPQRVQQLRFARDEETARIVETLRRRASVAGDDRRGVNLSELVLDTANGVVARCALGRSFAADEDGLRRRNVALEMVKKAMVITTKVVYLGDLWPSFSWIDYLRGVTGRLQSTLREVDSFLEKAIRDREAMLPINSGDDGFDSKHLYLADVLLRLQKDASCDFELTRDNIKAFLLDMIIGGTDTTSTAIEWLIAELVTNPRVMKKSQEEIRRVVLGDAGKNPKKKTIIEANDINRMEYLKCVIKESLRLHPPTPLLVPREISKEIRIGGFKVPAKTTLLVNAWAIQRDPRLWDRPDEFYPERFEKLGPVELRTGHDFGFVSFGFGRRACPGLGFGAASIECIVANLLCWFDWELPKISGDYSGMFFHEELDMSEDNIGHKKIPLRLVPILHDNNY